MSCRAPSKPPKETLTLHENVERADVFRLSFTSITQTNAFEARRIRRRAQYSHLPFELHHHHHHHWEHLFKGPITNTSIIMKITLLASCLPVLATALQSPYLSQLNGGARATWAPPNGAVATAPSHTGGGVPAPSAELLELWSNQVSVELSASQLYLSASIWFRAREMDGMAAWMLEESGEERGHGLQILEFAMKKGFPVNLKPLDAPRSDWQNAVQVWQDILQAERTNTQNLLKLAAVADQCGDYAAKAFLGPFHMEQLEAEDKVSAILAKVRVADDALMMQLDTELGMEADEEDHH